MISLFLDTSSSYLNVAVIKNHILLKEKYIFLEKDLSKKSVLTIKEVLDSLNLSPDDIDEIVCVNGPGSFTGLRIGVTIAKTFAWGLKKKLIAVSSLFTMATSIMNKDYIIPIIDARRGYVFAGIYDKNYQLIMEEQYINKEQLLTKVLKLKGTYIFVATTEFKDINVNKYNPNIVNLYKNLKLKTINPHEFVPNYLKMTEAEENLKL